MSGALLEWTIGGWTLHWHQWLRVRCEFRVPACNLYIRRDCLTITKRQKLCVLPSKSTITVIYHNQQWHRQYPKRLIELHVNKLWRPSRNPDLLSRELASRQWEVETRKNWSEFFMYKPTLESICLVIDCSRRMTFLTCMSLRPDLKQKLMLT